ncbi:hypothetical protein QOT17_015857 [Balamuthia mandrillaris]
MKSSQRPPLLLLGLLVLRLFWTATATIGSEPAARDPSEIVYTTGQCAVACGAPVITNAQLKIHRTSGSYTPYQGKEFETWRAGGPSTALITGVKQTGWYQIEDHFNSESCTDQRDETMFVTVQNECTKGTYGFPLRYNYNLKATDYNLNGNKALMVRDADNYIGNNNRMCSTDNDCSGREAMWVGETLVSQWGCKDQSSHGKCCSPKNPVVIGTFLLLKDKCRLGTSGCSTADKAANNRITIFSGCIDALYNEDAWENGNPPAERSFFSNNFCTTPESVHIQAGNVQLEKPKCPCDGVTCTAGKKPVEAGATCNCQCINDASSCTAANPNWREADCSCYCPLSNNQACATQNGNNPNFIKKKDGSCGCECGLSTSQCQSQLGPNAVFNPTSCSCSCPIDSNQDCVELKLSPWYEKTPGSCGCRCTLTQKGCEDLNGKESMFKADTCGCQCDATTSQWCRTKYSNNNWGKKSNRCECECQITDAKCRTQMQNSPYAKANTDPAVCGCFCPLTDDICAKDNGNNPAWRKKTNGECRCECGLDCHALGPDAVANQQCECSCPLTDEICANRKGGNADWKKHPDSCQCRCSLTEESCAEGYRLNPETCICECLILTDENCKEEHENYVVDTDGECKCMCGLSAEACAAVQTDGEGGPEEEEEEAGTSGLVFQESTCSCVEQADGGGGGGTSDGVIAGGVLGGVAGVAAVGLGAAAAAYFIRKKRKKLMRANVSSNLAKPGATPVSENPIFNPATTIVSSELYAAT